MLIGFLNSQKRYLGAYPALIYRLEDVEVHACAERDLSTDAYNGNARQKATEMFNKTIQNCHIVTLHNKSFQVYYSRDINEEGPGISRELLQTLTSRDYPNEALVSPLNPPFAMLIPAYASADVMALISTLREHFPKAMIIRDPFLLLGGL